MKFFKTEKINKTKDSLKTIITKNSKEANENCKKEQRTLTMVWALDSMPAACLLAALGAPSPSGACLPSSVGQTDDDALFLGMWEEGPGCHTSTA